MPWYTSKTLWVNVFALVAAMFPALTGFNLSTEEQVGGLAVLNLFLRMITKSPLTAGGTPSIFTR